MKNKIFIIKYFFNIKIKQNYLFLFFFLTDFYNTNVIKKKYVLITLKKKKKVVNILLNIKNMKKFL